MTTDETVMPAPEGLVPLTPGGGPLVSYEALAADVDTSGGLGTYSMFGLRELEAKGRLGRLVREQISDTLDGVGLGHLPEALPADQHASVRIYRHDSYVGRIIDAVLEPSPDGDALLHSLTTDDARTQVEQIRRIIG